MITLDQNLATYGENGTQNLKFVIIDKFVDVYIRKNFNDYLKKLEKNLGSLCIGKFINKMDHSLLVQVKFNYK